MKSSLWRMFGSWLLLLHGCLVKTNIFPEVLLKATRQEQIFCCWLPRDTEDHSTWFSHSESSLHLKNGVGRNFYHRDVDESFCHLQWFCGELQSWCKMRYLWSVCIWFIMPFSTVIISLWALQGACCHWYLAKTHIHSYKVGKSLKILIWNNSLATQFFKYV